MTVYAQLKAEPSKWEPIGLGCIDLRKHTSNYFEESIFQKGLVTIRASGIKASDLVNGLKEAGLL